MKQSSPSLSSVIRSAQYDDARADLHPPIQVDYVLVGKAEAARRDRLADRLRLVGAVDAEEGVAEIHGTRAEGILRSTLHVARQVGPAAEHLRRRRPGRPLLLRRHDGGA